jgi:hypothetical protein
MNGVLHTAGEHVEIDSSLSWVTDLIAEGAVGELHEADASATPIRVCVESSRERFETRGWELLTRGAWRRPGEVIVENACTAGFDLHVRCSAGRAEFTYRWRPPTRDRVAAMVLRSRFHLLARAILMQYPVFWWAGTRGRAPLHASACTAGTATPMITAPSGVGRSTLILRELARGARATGDNLAVGDGTTVWGLVEPLRVEGGGGRRMPHGRNEAPLPDRPESLTPDSLLVLARATSEAEALTRCGPEAAARALVTSTYMAGELRRYWAFAAMLAAGTSIGPAHPPVTEVAAMFAATLPCFSLALGRGAESGLSELLDAVEMAA